MKEQPSEQKDQEEKQEDEESPEKIGIYLRLAPGIKDESLELPSDGPIAVPSSIGKKGLNLLVNHLLNRSTDEEEDDEGENDEKSFPIPFDFLLNNKLLRSSVELAARRDGLYFEETITIEYFPAQKAPEGSENSEILPDWISCMRYRDDKLCCGGYDGAIRIIGSDCSELKSFNAHSGPIHCLDSSKFEKDGDFLVATGSIDQTLLTHSIQKTESGHDFRLHAVYSGGHFNSIQSVAFHPLSSQNTMASADWDGGLCIWKIPSLENTSSSDQPTKKPRTTQKDPKTTTHSVHEIYPTASFKAHQSSIESISWSIDKPQHLITGSWDHSLKVWDVENQECLLTLNGSKVVSAMGRCVNSDVVATGHSDATVRLWDTRVHNDKEKGNAKDVTASVMDKTFKLSHKGWVSAVQWSPKQPYVLATNSHDGCIKIWDIRSSVPLHTVRAHDKGAKGLCLAFSSDADAIYAGGSDCRVKKFSC